jgi:hypothetical protein
MYEIELAGDIAELPAKVVASRGRLLRRVSAWDDLRDVYTRMCADRAHELALGATPPMENWNAVVEPSIPEGPALLGFVAARIGRLLRRAFAAERLACRAPRSDYLTTVFARDV